MRLSYRLSDRGDTIVEVLIAIAVVSSVLGITYSVMNRNIINMRDNQERSEASKIAQGQIELLKYAWENNTANLTLSGSFCLESNGSRRDNPSGSREDLVNGYNGVCRFDSSASQANDGNYRVDIAGSSTGRHTVTVRWDRLGGGVSKVVMAYAVR